ncbi:hypothetical protein V6N11_058325 [Hibiscus sabdariffa]|uniref:Uncharacterized protein n=1 Tax=Hibiscus sabdariffa TaxID=183260 RepID=A0ABR2U3Y8_9ROSI
MEASEQTKVRKGQGSIQPFLAGANKGANAPVVQGSRSREHAPSQRQPSLLSLVDEASCTKPATPRETLNRKAAPNGIHGVHSQWITE